MLRAAMVPSCAWTIDCTIVKSIPDPCAFVVTKGGEQGVEEVRRQARPGIVAPPLVALGLGSLEGTGVIATVSLREP